MSQTLSSPVPSAAPPTRKKKVRPQKVPADVLAVLQAGFGYVPLNLRMYHALIEAGLLPSSNDYELIRGMILSKRPLDEEGQSMGKGERHVIANEDLSELCRVLDRSRYAVRSQNPVTLPDDGEPEPDVAIVIGPTHRYMDHHPSPDDIYCVFEISDETLRHDRTTKMHLYAEAGLPVYVIVNLQDSQVEFHAEPNEAERRYELRQVFRPGSDVVIPLRDRDELRLPVADLLPPVAGTGDSR